MRKSINLDNCWYYSLEIEKYLADKKIVNNNSVPKNHLELVKFKAAKANANGNGKVGLKKIE